MMYLLREYVKVEVNPFTYQEINIRLNYCKSIVCYNLTFLNTYVSILTRSSNAWSSTSSTSIR